MTYLVYMQLLDLLLSYLGKCTQPDVVWQHIQQMHRSSEKSKHFGNFRCNTAQDLDSHDPHHIRAEFELEQRIKCFLGLCLPI